MFRFDRTLLLTTLTLACWQAVVSADEGTTPVEAPARPSRAELRDRQLDVSLEARDIERVVTRLKRASELAKTRIAEAAKTTETASASLDKGASKDARADAQQAREMFKEIIKQLEALLKEETPQRVAAAQNLAQQLANLERQFAEQFPGVLNPQGGGSSKVDPKSQPMPQPGAGGTQGPQVDPKQQAPGSAGQNPPDTPSKPMPGSGGDQGEQTDPAQAAPGKDGKDGKGQAAPDSKPMPMDGKVGGGGTDKNAKPDDPPMPGQGGSGKAKPMTEEERREALARRAEQLVQMGETLKDVLKALLQSTDPSDKEAVERLQAILKETNLLETIEAAKNSAGLIRAGKLDEARLASLDLADRLTIAAQRLDAAYRAIVAPQLEDLRKLEQKLAGLREKLDSLETQAQIAGWHRDIKQALDQAEELGVSDKAREDLLDQMKLPGGDSLNINFTWALVNNRYQAPATYQRPLNNLIEEVQIRIQNLALGDMSSSTDEATPPKYQELVERYYEVLSSDGSGTDKKTDKPASKVRPDRKRQ